jgi:myo-inositol-hexaphosphate 3-phosphohydrolase
VKITRLKRGYRINLSDAEFQALEFLVSHGQGDMAGVDLREEYNLGGRIIDLLESGRFSEFAALAVDEDRRGSK